MRGRRVGVGEKDDQGVMDLDAFLDFNSQPMSLPVNGAEGILEAPISNSSLKNEQYFNSILGMAQLNQNLSSDVLNSTILGRSMTSRNGTGHNAAVAVASQETFAPFLDDGICCSRRLTQYLYDMRNNTHDSGISYWKKFVSEYYAPRSKIRWCFSKYENIEQLQIASGFFRKSVGNHCCQICGLKSGKGFEATSETFPRLFKLKFESGMLDEILYIDSPQVHKVPNGLVLEYGKAVQTSVYETFRVVHNGKLRVVFRHDLKILSWEFCIENHEEYLLRTLFIPQVNKLVDAIEKYQRIQNFVSSKFSLWELRKVFNMLASAGIQIAKNVELPLVTNLGYSKRFIRCLQICEVVDSMKDLMALSQDTKIGAIECWNNYSRVRKIHSQGRSRGLAFLGQNSSTAMAFERSLNSHFHKEVAVPSLPFQSSESSQISPQALVDKMILKTLAVSRRRSTQDTRTVTRDRMSNPTKHMQRARKKKCCSESSNAAATQVNSTNT